MLVPAVVAAVSALMVAGLIDRVPGRPDPEHAVVIDRSVVGASKHGGDGAAGHAAPNATSASTDRVHGRRPGPTVEPRAPTAARGDGASASVATELPATPVVGDVGTTASTDQQSARNVNSVSTTDPASTDPGSITSVEILTTRSAPASTAALESSTTSDSILSTSTVRPDDVDTGERYRRFVTDAGLDDVDYVTPHLAHGTRVAGKQRVNVLILDHLETAAIRVSPGGRAPAPVGAWAAEIGAQAAINANWFSGRGGFDGPFVADGAVYGGRDHHYTALFGFTADKRLVTQHHSVVNDTVDERVVQGVAGHPTLIDRGRITVDFGGDPTFIRRHPRTAIGAAHGGEIVLFVTIDGRSSRARGMTGAETAALMADLGASHAVMLDGGGSSAMWIENRGVVNTQSDPGRRVGNQIAIFGR
jgi:hypothetical protein